LVHGPGVVLGKLLDFFGANGVNMLVQLVGANRLDQILDGLLNLVILRLELLTFGGDPAFLHLHELVEGVGARILGQVDKHCFGQRFQVVLNSILHNVVDVDNKLFELGKTCVHVSQVTVDVHRSPGEGDHTRAQLVLEIFKVRHQKRLRVGSNFGNNAIIFAQNELELVIVLLELLLLQEHNLGTFGDLDTNARKAFGFTDKSHDFLVEVDLQFVVGWLADDQSGQKTDLGLFDLHDPSLSPFVLVVEQVVRQIVVILNNLRLLAVLGFEQVTGEVLHRDGRAVEEMARPGD